MNSEQQKTDINHTPHKSPELVWIVFEENQTWAVPKRPKFVINGSMIDVETLIGDINNIFRSVIGNKMAGGTHLSFEPIRLFDSVDQYMILERAIFNHRSLEDLRHRTRIDLLNNTSNV